VYTVRSPAPNWRSNCGAQHQEGTLLTFTTKLTVQAGQEQAFERMMCIAVPKVREEPGNHAYIFHRSTQDPRVFMLYEEYEDQAACEAHRAHLREMDMDLQALLDGPPIVEFYEKLA
jgi:quinol monooxygenase YgiN